LQQVLDKYIIDLEELNRPYEIIAVNDGCTDGSVDILTRYKKNHRSLRIVNLDGRYGKQAAIIAGMDNADPKSQAIIIADVDILNPVGILGEVVERIDDGEKIVHAVRENFAFNRVKAYLSDMTVKVGAAMFGVEGFYTGKANIAAYSRPVADVILALPERNKYLRTMDTWLEWEIDYFNYASCYDKTETKSVIKEAQTKANEAAHVKGYGRKARDRVREHTASTQVVNGFLLLALVVMIIGIVYSVIGEGVLYINLMIWFGFALLVGITILFYIRAVLIKRVGIVNMTKDGKYYEIVDIVN